MEASAFPASVGVSRPRIAISAPLLRFRSDEQLISLFRSGSEDAFRVIHDRYRARMLAYTRQMLSSSPADAEDAVQEIFVRAYAGLLASDRRLALRAWLYRVAHNRCIDELRRPQVHPCDQEPGADPDASNDPVARLEQRDALERLIADVQRLPEQQRSALLMRELGGMTYVDVAAALSVTVPAVKSLLVRARVGLAQANEARDTACATIREDLILSHDRGVRASGLARRHLRDCPDCRTFRNDVRGVSRQLAAVVPGLGPVAMVAKLLGIGGGGGAAAGGGAVASGSATAAGTVTAGSAAGGALSLGSIAGAGHVVTVLAAAVVTAGGAIELQHITPATPHHAAHHRVMARPAAPAPSPAATPQAATAAASAAAPVQAAAVTPTSSTATPAFGQKATGRTQASARAARTHSTPALSEILDPDMMQVFPVPGPVTPTTPGATPGSASTAGTTTGNSSATTMGTAAPGSTTAAGSSTASTTQSGTGSSTGSGQTAPTTGASSTPTTSAGSSTATGSSTTAGTSGSDSSSSPGTAPTQSASTTSATAGGTTASSQTSTRAAHPAQATGSPATAAPTSAPLPRHRVGSRGTKRARHGIMAVFTLTETH